MVKDYQIFDAASFRLQKGTHLIEASAGTGKTYAIGMLTLRAVVELNIKIDQILIVTFTKAATEELRFRIRSRLNEAKNLLLADQTLVSADTDDTLLHWLATVTDRKEALLRLQEALFDIDKAAIFTIHGFCQRMLSEQALESGQLFDLELLSDIDEIRQELVDDFWRRKLYGLTPLACNIVTTRFATPEKLYDSVALAGKQLGKLEPEFSEEVAIETLLEQLDSNYLHLQNWWKNYGETLLLRFQKGIEKKCFKKEVNEDFDLWFSALHRFLSGYSYEIPEKLYLLQREELLGALNGNVLRGDSKKTEFLADWQLPTTEVESFLVAADSFLLLLRMRLAQELRSELLARLEKKGAMGFDDLILRLAKAIELDNESSLVPILGTRYLFALIDEFQDTDALQYKIFSTLFGGGGHFLYLIGDPKQAIYKFRGADIYSYFEAKKEATGLLTLEKNYRSHPHIVHEVNRLFGSREKPFLYEETVLGYRPVVPAKGEEDIGLVAGSSQQSLAGMVYCSLEKHPKQAEGRWSSTEAQEGICSFVVGEIVRLLHTDKSVQIVTSNEQTREQRTVPLTPKDIAILVRTHNQAEEYKAALNFASVPAVVASKQSVFATRECKELTILLQAIVSATDLSRVKSCMTISWFGKTGTELHKIWEDETALHHYQTKFFDYHTLWLEKGFLVMMSSLLETENVLYVLASQPHAERSIVNIGHLLELIQQRVDEFFLGIEQTVVWLETMHNSQKRVEEGELQLESDEEAVQIVTMHGAKGLEYPVLFCPFLWYESDWVKNEKYQVSCHDLDNNLLVDLGSSEFEERKKNAIEEQRAENIRLLYVAVTRAKLRCYTMWADVKGSGSVQDSFSSPLGYLLFPTGQVDSSEQENFFQNLTSIPGVYHKKVMLDEPVQTYTHQSITPELAARVQSGRSLQTAWQMSSFSALAKLSDYEFEASPQGGVDNITSDAADSLYTNLPAGPNFGNVIHDLLEDLSFKELASEHSFTIEIENKCKRYGVDADVSELRELLRSVCKAQLPAPFSLSQLPESVCAKEMDFYFHVNELKTEKINKVLRDEETCVPLHPSEMKGYLTGFMDLVCKWGDKYYIIDYKSNYLGEMAADYSQDNLVLAMREHNYGLQYWIYSVVLHCHLRNHLPEYSYERHFGGVMYLFVRAMSPKTPGAGVYYSVPDFSTLSKLEEIIGGPDD